jgi:hypothetical protein
MATGLQVWLPNGTLVVDTTTSVVLILGTFQIGGVGFPQTGTVTDNRLYNGRPYSFQLLGGIPGADNKEAVITASGNTITWRFPEADASQPLNRPNTTVMYGTF